MFTKMMTMLKAPAALKGLLAAAVIGISPVAALARPYDDHFDFRFHEYRPHVAVIAPVPAPAVCENQTVQVWIGPAYRTVTDRVWVPARFEDRDVTRWVGGRRVIERQHVLVRDGHYEDVQRQELVTPGHYETRIEPVAVAP